MKIKELIERLQCFDINQTVEIYDPVRDEFRHIRCVNQDRADLIVEITVGDVSPELT